MATSPRCEDACELGACQVLAQKSFVYVSFTGDGDKEAPPLHENTTPESAVTAASAAMAALNRRVDELGGRFVKVSTCPAPMHRPH